MMQRDEEVRLSKAMPRRRAGSACPCLLLLLLILVQEASPTKIPTLRRSSPPERKVDSLPHLAEDSEIEELLLVQEASPVPAKTSTLGTSSPSESNVKSLPEDSEIELVLLFKGDGDIRCRSVGEKLDVLRRESSPSLSSSQNDAAAGGNFSIENFNGEGESGSRSVAETGDGQPGVTSPHLPTSQSNAAEPNFEIGEGSTSSTEAAIQQRGRKRWRGEIRETSGDRRSGTSSIVKTVGGEPEKTSPSLPCPQSNAEGPKSEIGEGSTISMDTAVHAERLREGEFQESSQDSRSGSSSVEKTVGGQPEKTSPFLPSTKSNAKGLDSEIRNGKTISMDAAAGERWWTGRFQESSESDKWPEFKLGWRTVSAIILGGLGAAISSAGGLGGGGLFVPLFNLLLQFDTKTSAALSNFMILGGSVANLYINLRQTHPTLHHKPLIDFDVLLLLQPNMLLGISTGVILNVVLPDWVITALLAITLGYMSIYSFKGAVRRWKKETFQNHQGLRNSAGYVPAPDFHHTLEDELTDEEEEEVEEGVEQGAGNHEKKKGDDGSRLEENRGPGNVGNEEAARQLLVGKQQLQTGRGKRSSLPVTNVLALAITWLAFFAVQVLRGGKDNQSILGFQACGLGYWLVTSTQIPIALGVTIWTIRRFHAAHACKQDPECIQEEGFTLKPESCTSFAWTALIAGILGGLLGIGGGMIINPVLLTVGMIPQVTAGTCASMVFFSSSMSVVQFWLMGRVPVAFALSGALICAVCSFVGVTLLHRAIEKYNRASLIVFSVTIVMGVSAVLMAGFGGLGVWQKFRSGAYMGFHHPC